MNKPPIKKWRAGNVEIAIWDNEREMNGATISFKTATLSRSYRKKDEEQWRSEVINSIRRQDMAKMIAVLQKAQDYLFFEANQREEDEGDE